MIFLMLSVCGGHSNCKFVFFNHLFIKNIESKYISYIFSDIEPVHISYGCTLIIQFIVHVMPKSF